MSKLAQYGLYVELHGHEDPASVQRIQAQLAEHLTEGLRHQGILANPALYQPWRDPYRAGVVVRLAPAKLERQPRAR